MSPRRRSRSASSSRSSSSRASSSPRLRCVACTVQGRRCSNAPYERWSSLPPGVRTRVCGLLGVAECTRSKAASSSCELCAVHLRGALSQALHEPANALLKYLLEKVVCQAAGWDPNVCEDQFTAWEGYATRYG